MGTYDARKAWCPEMLDELKKYWTSKISWEEFIKFARHITEERTKIRNEKGIKSIRMQCKECGSNMTLPPISVRSCLFALRKLNVVNEEQFKQLEQDWKKHQRLNRLDAYGNSKIQNIQSVRD
jgi:hypothetical protein